MQYNWLWLTTWAWIKSSYKCIIRWMQCSHFVHKTNFSIGHLAEMGPKKHYSQRTQYQNNLWNCFQDPWLKHGSIVLFIVLVLFLRNQLLKCIQTWCQSFLCAPSLDILMHHVSYSGMLGSDTSRHSMRHFGFFFLVCNPTRNRPLSWLLFPPCYHCATEGAVGCKAQTQAKLTSYTCRWCWIHK